MHIMQRMMKIIVFRVMMLKGIFYYTCFLPDGPIPLRLLDVHAICVIEKSCGVFSVPVFDLNVPSTSELE